MKTVNYDTHLPESVCAALQGAASEINLMPGAAASLILEYLRDGIVFEVRNARMKNSPAIFEEQRLRVRLRVAAETKRVIDQAAFETCATKSGVGTLLLSNRAPDFARLLAEALCLKKDATND